MGPGFGGINIGGFALPEINMEEVNAGIAAQLAPEIAKYLAEQDLSFATNEFEKDVAENTIDQITDYETGIGTLPPVVEEILEEIRQPKEDVVYARDDRPIRGYSPSYFGGEDERAIGRENEGIASIATPAPAPTPAPAYFNAPKLTNEELAAGIRGLYNFEDERAIGRENEAPYIPSDLTPPDIINPIIEIDRSAPRIGRENIPPYDPDQLPGEFSEPVRLPDNERVFGRPVLESSPISNLIQQQRQAYNSALQNAVYNPQPSQQRSMYIRPMSAAEFGSRPGEEFQTAPNFIAMKGGGSMKLPNSPMNMGLGGLPPMQQNDKLTQLFAQSFNPRR